MTTISLDEQTQQIKEGIPNFSAWVRLKLLEHADIVPPRPMKWVSQCPANTSHRWHSATKERAGFPKDYCPICIMNGDQAERAGAMFPTVGKVRPWHEVELTVWAETWDE